VAPGGYRLAATGGDLIVIQRSSDHLPSPCEFSQNAEHPSFTRKLGMGLFFSPDSVIPLTRAGATPATLREGRLTRAPKKLSWINHESRDRQSCWVSQIALNPTYASPKKLCFFFPLSASVIASTAVVSRCVAISPVVGTAINSPQHEFEVKIYASCQSVFDQPLGRSPRPQPSERAGLRGLAMTESGGKKKPTP
jgi:hypothetical protein